MDFTGKTAIVTGGARGLGLSYARALARGGARVVIGSVVSRITTVPRHGLNPAGQ